MVEVLFRHLLIYSDKKSSGNETGEEKVKKLFKSKRMGIKSKLVLLIVTLIVLTVAATGSMLYIKMSQSITDQTQNDMLNQAKGNVALLSSLAKQNWVKLGIVASHDGVTQLLESETNGTPDRDLQTTVNRELGNFVKQNNGEIEYAFLVNTKGNIIADSDPKLLGRNINAREYTKQTLLGKPQASEALASEQSGSPVVVYTQPIVINGKISGFVASAVLTKSFSQYLDSIKVTNSPSGYAYLVDAKGIRIYHKTANLILKPVETAEVKEVVAKAHEGKTTEGIIHFFFGGPRTAAYEIVPETHWILVIAADTTEFTLPLKTLTWYILTIGLIFSMIASVIGYLFAQRLISPLKSLTHIIERTAYLDLVIDDSAYGKLRQRKDEIGVMAQAMFQMRQVLLDLVKHLIHSTEIIGINAQGLNEVADEVSGYASDSSATTQQLSAGMEESAAATEEIAAATDEVKRSAESISAGVITGQEISGAVSQRALLLKQETLDSKEIATTLYTEVKEKMEVALEQAEKVSQINQLAEAILQIAQQTNLLSLNAAIEAARAGEAGRGFSVVADEIRKLAEQSSQTVGDIQRMVDLVTSSMSHITKNGERLLQFVDENVTKDYEKFVQVSEQYDQDAQIISHLMTEFNKTSEELLQGISSISVAISEVAKTANEGASGAQEIASKSGAIVEQADRVKKASGENLESIKVLQEFMARFKINQDI